MDISIIWHGLTDPHSDYDIDSVIWCMVYSVKYAQNFVCLVSLGFIMNSLWTRLIYLSSLAMIVPASAK